MKNIAGLSLMKDLGCHPQGEASDSMNALSGAGSAIEIKVIQACKERRFLSRTLSSNAGVRDVEPVKWHCIYIRERKCA